MIRIIFLFQKYNYFIIPCGWWVIWNLMCSLKIKVSRFSPDLIKFMKYIESKLSKSRRLGSFCNHGLQSVDSERCNITESCRLGSYQILENIPLVKRNIKLFSKSLNILKQFRYGDYRLQFQKTMDVFVHSINDNFFQPVFFVYLFLFCEIDFNEFHTCIINYFDFRKRRLQIKFKFHTN